MAPPRTRKKSVFLVEGSEVGAGGTLWDMGVHEAIKNLKPL